MIDVKQAVRIAKINSTEILGMDGDGRNGHGFRAPC